MESQFNDMGDMHFIALGMSNKNQSTKTPIEKLIQNDEGINEPMPYFELNIENLGVTFHCPLKYEYMEMKSNYLGFAKRSDLTIANGENVGSVLSAKVNEDGFRLR